MSLKKHIVLAASLLLLVGCSTQLRKLAKKVDQFSSKGSPRDSVLLTIQKESDLVIGYSTYNEAWGHVPVVYYLVGFKGNRTTSYYYQINRFVINNQKKYVLDSFNAGKETRDSIFAAFKKAKGWSLKHVEDADVLYCSHSPDKFCNISDASSKNLIVLTRTNQQISSFYAPEFFENQCCPGNDDRKRLLSIIEPISNHFLTKEK